MLHKDVAEQESNFLRELIEGCLEAEGYKVRKISKTTYKVKTKLGNELNVHIAIKGA